MKLELRKFTKFVDKTFIEGGKEAKEPVLMVSVAAVFKNPWHGKGFVEDLKPVILDLAQGRTVEISSNLFYILIYIAIFPSIGSYYCWAGAVSIIGANRAGIFLSLIPLFSTILAILLFNEKFLFFHLIGSVLIILGLFLSNKKITNA